MSAKDNDDQGEEEEKKDSTNTWLVGADKFGSDIDPCLQGSLTYPSATVVIESATNNIPGSIVKQRIEDGEYTGQLIYKDNHMYLCSGQEKKIHVYKATNASPNSPLSLLKMHERQNAPECMLLLPDGGGIREGPVILFGEEDGLIEISEVTGKGLLKSVGEI